ncbi:unnamed protein product [Brugia pahangi]|uniref:Aa_trans domain-containing protein n=1 Tax=Brugia pahangi TaxID=6280 RepID=A0A0N4TLB2_BRUPA|nr:unnamed protein product [Brugia pahangi]
MQKNCANISLKSTSLVSKSTLIAFVLDDCSRKNIGIALLPITFVYVCVGLALATIAIVFLCDTLVSAIWWPTDHRAQY